MSQEEKQAVPISVVALRAEGYSANGDNIIISLRTKYSATERKYSVPIDCFRDLILDLRRLNAFSSADPTDNSPEVEPFLPLDMPITAE